MELHLFANELVCSYDDVYFSVFEVIEDLFESFGGSGSGEVFDSDGEVFQS